MSCFYFTNTPYQLELDTQLDLQCVASAVIKYKAPDDTEGEFVAVLGTSGVIYYNLTIEIDQVGTWTFWPKVTFQDTTVIPGNTSSVSFIAEGT